VGPARDMMEHEYNTLDYKMFYDDDGRYVLILSKVVNGKEYKYGILLPRDEIEYAERLFYIKSRELNGLSNDMLRHFAISKYFDAHMCKIKKD